MRQPPANSARRRRRHDERRAAPLSATTDLQVHLLADIRDVPRKTTASCSRLDGCYREGQSPHREMAARQRPRRVRPRPRTATTQVLRRRVWKGEPCHPRRLCRACPIRSSIGVIAEIAPARHHSCPAQDVDPLTEAYQRIRLEKLRHFGIGARPVAPAVAQIVDQDDVGRQLPEILDQPLALQRQIVVQPGVGRGIDGGRLRASAARTRGATDSPGGKPTRPRHHAPADARSPPRRSASGCGDAV